MQWICMIIIIEINSGTCMYTYLWIYMYMLLPNVSIHTCVLVVLTSKAPPIFVMSFWLSFESTLRSSKYQFYSIVPGCQTPRCPILMGLCLEQCHRQQSQQLIKKSGSLPLEARSVVTTTGIQLTQENRTVLLAAISARVYFHVVNSIL